MSLYKGRKYHPLQVTIQATITSSIQQSPNPFYALQSSHRLPVRPSKRHQTHAAMPLASSRRTAPRTSTRTTRSTAHPSLKSKLLGSNKRHTATKRNPITGTTTTTTTTTKTTRTTGGHHSAGRTTAAPVHHHKRHATMGDKVSGALTKLKGTLTGRPGVKAAGTRRMHGTDGRNARHVY